MTDKYFPNTFRLYKAHTSSELGSLKDYINHSTKSILKAQEEFEKEYDFSVNEEGQEDYWKYEYYKVHEIFPSFYRQSTFIGIYSFLETRLQSLCNILQRIKGYTIKISDLNGENYIEKSKKYFKLVAGLNIDDLNPKWMQITQYQKIRNCIVHNNGNIYTNKNQTLQEQKLYTIVNDNHNLELNSNGQINIVGDDFLLDFITLIKNYLSEVVEKIKQQIDFG